LRRDVTRCLYSNTACHGQWYWKQSNVHYLLEGKIWGWSLNWAMDSSKCLLLYDYQVSTSYLVSQLPVKHKYYAKQNLDYLKKLTCGKYFSLKTLINVVSWLVRSLQPRLKAWRCLNPVPPNSFIDNLSQFNQLIPLLGCLVELHQKLFIILCNSSSRVEGRRIHLHSYNRWE